MSVWLAQLSICHTTLNSLQPQTACKAKNELLYSKFQCWHEILYYYYYFHVLSWIYR